MANTLNGKRINMTLMITCNHKHNKNYFCSMRFKELSFFAYVKRKVVKTHRHVQDYSAKKRVFFYKSP